MSLGTGGQAPAYPPMPIRVAYGLRGVSHGLVTGLLALLVVGGVATGVVVGLRQVTGGTMPAPVAAAPPPYVPVAVPKPAPVHPGVPVIPLPTVPVPTFGVHLPTPAAVPTVPGRPTPSAAPTHSGPAYGPGQVDHGIRAEALQIGQLDAGTFAGQAVVRNTTRAAAGFLASFTLVDSRGRTVDTLSNVVESVRAGHSLTITVYGTKQFVGTTAYRWRFAVQPI